MPIIDFLRVHYRRRFLSKIHHEKHASLNMEMQNYISNMHQAIAN